MVDIEAGQRIAGHYRIIERIATGATGVVWLARDEHLQRLVAIKQLVLHPGLSAAEAEETRRRALREARIAARVQHPNAVRVFDVTEHRGQPCLVLEYLPSRSVATLVTENGPMAPGRVATIGRQIAGALAAAHKAHVVHRDVKPANILFSDAGAAKITDFGISRAPGDGTLTETGMVAGTPAFLAPEVARGQQPTAAADVFSLAASLYAAVEGHGPFGEENNQLALLHTAAAGRIQPMHRAGPLAPILERALASDPDSRPTMEQLRTSLSSRFDPHAVAGGQARAQQPAQQSVSRPAGARRSRRTTAPRRSGARRVGVLVAAVLTVLALGGVAAATVIVKTGGEPGRQTQQPPAGAPAPDRASGSVPQPSPARAVPVDLSGRPIEYTPAGRLVVEYYAGAHRPDGAWTMLTPHAQSGFGGRDAFRGYWDRYSQVWAGNAVGVTSNPDGSVTVPVEVGYVTGSRQWTERREVRVVRGSGRLLIDTPAR